MKGARLGSKYFVALGKMAHAVAPSLPSASRQRNVDPCPCGSRLMPRCFSYQLYSFSGSSALKKTPPKPVTCGMHHLPKCLILRAPKARHLLHPIGNKNIGFVRDLAISVRRPDQFFPIRTEHGKRVEVGMVSHTLQRASIHINDVKVEVTTILRIVHVRGEDDALAVGQKVGSEIRRPIVRDLALVAAVRIHHPDFQVPGTNQPAR